MNVTALTPEQRARFIRAADAALSVRRNALRMAAHMTGHRQRPHSESCEECREKWPCVDVTRAASPLLDAVAELPLQERTGIWWAINRLATIRLRKTATEYQGEWWRGYEAALDDLLRLAGEPQGDPTHLAATGVSDE